MKNTQNLKFATKAIHSEISPEPATGAVTPPIYMTSTYAQNAPNEHQGYDYTRAGNPNFTNLERTLAALDDAPFATVYAAGLGAITAVMTTLKPGDLVLSGNDLYGGTFRLFDRVFRQYGIRLQVVDTTDLIAVAEAMQAQPKMVYLETPSNPLLRISDISAISEMAHQIGATVVVDNTFSTPYFQKPLAEGADVVIYSTTKYLGGHSDLVGGAAVTHDAALHEQLQFARMAIGMNPSPFDCWLTSRGIKTLAVRMERHAQNALAIANYLEQHSKAAQVYYPGLTSHPQHELADRQMSGFSGIVSVEFALSLEQTKKLISSFSIFTLAESLGGVESLVDHPATMTHASIPKEQRDRIGLRDGLVRLSVGVEDAQDLIADLDTQLARV